MGRRDRIATRGRRGLCGLAAAMLLTACSEGGSDGASQPSASDASPAPAAESQAAGSGASSGGEPANDARTPEALAAAGRSVYNANCIACHAMDPTQDGALGPAVAGSSLELLETRVLRGEYPPGYVPKRPSRVMVPLPHLEPRLPELAAYLNSL